MESKLKLEPDYTLKQVSHKSKGSMAETDIYNIEILNSNGEVVGTVEHTDTTSRKGKRTQEVVQRDMSGNIVVDERW